MSLNVYKNKYNTFIETMKRYFISKMHVYVIKKRIPISNNTNYQLLSIKPSEPYLSILKGKKATQIALMWCHFKVP